MNLIKITLLSSLLLSTALTRAVEERTTIYSSDGYEKELAINIPSQFSSRSDHYVKAYVIKYMEWWNRGVGTTARNALKYHFDITHFEENTPPQRVAIDVERAVSAHFSRNNVWEKVALEGANFIDEVNYKANNIEVNTLELKLKTDWGNPAGPTSINIPKKYTKRAEEYRNEYAINYIKLWNLILRKEEPEGLDTYYDTFRLNADRKFHWEFSGIRIGGDVKNDIRKLFSSPEMQKQIRKDQREHAESEGVKAARKRREGWNKKS